MNNPQRASLGKLTHVPFFQVERGGGKRICEIRLPRQCFGPPEPEYESATMGSCGVDGGGTGLGMGEGEGVAIGPITPSALQLALARGVGVAPSMPSSVAVMTEGTDVPGMREEPCQTSTRSKFVPLSCAFAPMGMSVSPSLAVCAVAVWKNWRSGARTSIVVAREMAMTRRRIADDVTIRMRGVSAMVETLR